MTGKPLFDFPTDAQMVADYIKSGNQPDDAMYLEAVTRLDPPLVDPAMLDAIFKELDRKRMRRGRPRTNALSKECVAHSLENIERVDAPPLFLAGLAGRIRSGKRVPDVRTLFSTSKKLKQQDRDFLIRAIYSEIYPLIGSASRIVHEIIGELEVPDTGSRSERALQLTQHVIMTRCGHRTPSIDTMRNMVRINSRRIS